MTLICAFTFYGESIAKGRPRATVQGGFARLYTPARTATFEGKVKAVAVVTMAGVGHAPTPDAVHVEIGFERAMPVSWPKKKRLLMAGEPIIGSPDIDNQVKAILDAMNGIVFEDDRQVSDLTVSRRWGETSNFRISVSLASGPGVLAEAA